ncbi:oligosaccharide repeat unit polymerase [Aquitalea sp. ASV15]|uniref:oligosaccharide repeat unit polymerase n=1 Tax=Aquitalea sp. ASV15 TaxID=2795104 RepID=UPI0018EAA797|nr:oligosaccharide repeat unit polymerase [Aquitalea sp. ASV15]
MINITDSKKIWLLIYIISNMVAATIIFFTGMLVGDFEGVPFEDDFLLLFSLAIILISYWFFLGPLFSWVKRFKVDGNRGNTCNRNEKYLFGIVLFFMQIGFMAFNLLEGVNAAGSGGAVSNSPFAIIWVIFPVDMLFVIYYPLCRYEKMFKFNLIIWLVSNLQRGWSGVFIILMFFELGILAKKGKLSISRVSIVGVGVLILYPFVIASKWVIRSFSKVGFDFFDMSTGLVRAFSEIDYVAALSEGFLHLIGRLQTVSALIETIVIRKTLSHAFDAGSFLPFWKEGLFGLLYDKVFSVGKIMTLGVYFTQYTGPNNAIGDLGEWNVNSGFPSWVFIAPEYLFFYLGYVFMLCVFSVFLTKKISADDFQLDGLWLIWLLFLLPPWLGAFVGYIYAMIVFIAIMWCVNKMTTLFFVSE